VKVRVTPYNDPSVFTSTATTVVCSIATQTQQANVFNWSRSFNGYSGNVTYTIQYDSAGKNFAVPKQIAIGNNLYTKAMLQKELDETGLNVVIAGGSVGKVECRIKP